MAKKDDTRVTIFTDDGKPIETTGQQIAEVAAAVSGNFAGGQLRSLIERIERLEEEKAAIAGDIKEVYAEAKAHGFDTKTIRRVIRERKMAEADRQEQLELFDLYWDAVHG